MSILFGSDRQELKNRMERIIAAEDETVKAIKKQIVTMEQLIKCIGEHKQVMERMLTKL